MFAGTAPYCQRLMNELSAHALQMTLFNEIIILSAHFPHIWSIIANEEDVLFFYRQGFWLALVSGSVKMARGGPGSNLAVNIAQVTAPTPDFVITTLRAVKYQSSRKSVLLSLLPAWIDPVRDLTTYLDHRGMRRRGAGHVALSGCRYLYWIFMRPHQS